MRSSPPGPRDRDTLHFDFWPVEGGRSSGDFRGGPQAVCSGALYATLSGPVRNHLALDEVYTVPPKPLSMNTLFPLLCVHAACGVPVLPPGLLSLCLPRAVALCGAGLS